LRRNRFLAAAVLAATVAVSTGCASSPPPVSQQVQDYYDANKDRPLGVTPGASPASASAAAKPSVAPIPVGFDLASIKAALASNPAVTISVLGDSTGNSTGEWVDLWGKHLSTTASVTIHLWDQDKESWRPNATAYPGPEGRTIEIWNGSQPGSTADYPSSRLKVMQPNKPDFVILNFGHNGSAGAVASQLQQTTDAVSAQWGGKLPTVAILQNAAGAPRTMQTDANQNVLKAWAVSTGIPTIDVRSAFDALPDLKAYLVDDGLGVHPNPAGQQIWADTVVATLG